MGYIHVANDRANKYTSKCRRVSSYLSGMTTTVITSVRQPHTEPTRRDYRQPDTYPYLVVHLWITCGMHPTHAYVYVTVSKSSLGSTWESLGCIPMCVQEPRTGGGLLSNLLQADLRVSGSKVHESAEEADGPKKCPHTTHHHHGTLQSHYSCRAPRKFLVLL